jgi:hypothetical protein
LKLQKTNINRIIKFNRVHDQNYGFNRLSHEALIDLKYYHFNIKKLHLKKIKLDYVSTYYLDCFQIRFQICQVDRVILGQLLHNLI